MGRFKYRAMDSSNQKVEGKYDARSKEEVIAFITSNDLYPLMVEEITESTEIKFTVNRKVKVKDIAVLCRQFYTMLNAGVQILECLTILSGQIENVKLRNAISQIEEDVKKGGVLSEAMKKHEKIFPSLLISLVASGEASGRLDSVMLRMADYYEKQNKTGNKVKNAMIYPMVLGIVACSSIVFILIYVMPTFVQMFKETGTELPWNTKLLLWSSDAIQNHWLVLIIMILGITIGLKYYFDTEQGKITSSQLKLKLPILKALNQKIIVSQFTRTMSTLMGSGLPLLDALDIVTDVVSNKVAQDALITIREKVARGEGLYSSIKEAGIFPNMLSSMVKIGEETGSIDDILGKTADFYDEELDAEVQRAVTLMEPLMIVVMGLIIGFIVVSIMLPMFDSYTKM
jgi:type IV pilus assembly protein PilC